MAEEEVQFYVMQMRQPGNLRASLNHYGYIPQMAEQTKELTRSKLTAPMLAWGGRRSFGDHCINSAKAIATSAEGGVIEECGHWVFEEKTDFISRRPCSSTRSVLFDGADVGDIDFDTTIDCRNGAGRAFAG